MKNVLFYKTKTRRGRVGDAQIGMEYKIIRIRKGLTLRYVATQCGISDVAVSLFERGYNQTPRIKDLLDKIYEITGGTI